MKTSGTKTAISKDVKEEFYSIYNLIDPLQPFSRVMNLFYLLKCLMLEADYIEEALKFGAFLRSLEKIKNKEEVIVKTQIIKDADDFLSPFLEM